MGQHYVQFTFLEHLPHAKKGFESSACIYLIESSWKLKVGLSLYIPLQMRNQRNVGCLAKVTQLAAR